MRRDPSDLIIDPDPDHPKGTHPKHFPFYFLKTTPPPPPALATLMATTERKFQKIDKIFERTFINALVTHSFSTRAAGLFLIFS